MATPAAIFRAKTNCMKSWRPLNPPSNRDRLELYALHKQSVSGDAPTITTDDDSKSRSVANKAKLSAWMSKRGLAQGDAMTAYVEECDRQLRVYGSRDNTNGSEQATSEATSETDTGTSSPPNIQCNTQGNSPMGGEAVTTTENVLLCPRGLAAIPLLCAAASESRSAYLARLQVTSVSNGWWAKQEPLCLEVSNPLSIPEKLIIALAAHVEKLSLVVSNYMGQGHAVSIMSPRVLQAFLWPIHNVLLCTWITLILTTTFLGSIAIMCQTLLFGAKRTNAPLMSLFAEEVQPLACAVETLVEEHQVVGVRVTGLALMPMMMLCDFTTSVVVERVGILVGSLMFVGMGVCSWWYWICVLPWLTVCSLCLAVMSGWCFGLIELAGN